MTRRLVRYSLLTVSGYFKNNDIALELQNLLKNCHFWADTFPCPFLMPSFIERRGRKIAIQTGTDPGFRVVTSNLSFVSFSMKFKQNVWVVRLGRSPKSAMTRKVIESIISGLRFLTPFVSFLHRYTKSSGGECEIVGRIDLSELSVAELHNILNLSEVLRVYSRSGVPIDPGLTRFNEDEPSSGVRNIRPGVRARCRLVRSRPVKLVV